MEKLAQEYLNALLKYGKYVLAIIIGGWVLLGGIDSFFGKTEPTIIHREFNNGKVIDVEVDRTLTREGWNCSNPSCSGHNAGYDWAEENGITDPSDCGGKSESFIEGCETYANEQSSW